jgi:hypothetical protein
MGTHGRHLVVVQQPSKHSVLAAARYSATLQPCIDMVPMNKAPAVDCQASKAAAWSVQMDTNHFSTLCRLEVNIRV